MASAFGQEISKVGAVGVFGAATIVLLAHELILVAVYAVTRETGLAKALRLTGAGIYADRGLAAAAVLVAALIQRLAFRAITTVAGIARADMASMAVVAFGETATLALSRVGAHIDFLARLAIALVTDLAGAVRETRARVRAQCVLVAMVATLAQVNTINAVLSSGALPAFHALARVLPFVHLPEDGICAAHLLRLGFVSKDNCFRNLDIATSHVSKFAELQLAFLRIVRNIESRLAHSFQMEIHTRGGALDRYLELEEATGCVINSLMGNSTVDDNIGRVNAL
jgi:hypothetical protein